MRFWFRFPATPSSDATRAQRRRSLLLATVLIAVLPLAWRGPSCGQDFDFHLQNWLEVVQHWRHGVLWPHWAATANYLAGEPRFVFYPPLSWILGGVLGLILPWSWTPVAYTLIALLGAGFAFRAMARAWMPLDSATLAACVYVVNPYTLFVVYERGALAELLGATWIPLLVLFALRDDSGRSSSIRNVLLLAVTVAALWLTNAPAAVMGCYTLVVLVAVAVLQQRADPKRSWRLLSRSLFAVPLGLALAGFWLVPAIYEQRWVQIDRAIGPLMRVEDSFLFGYVPLAGVPTADQFDTIYHNGVLRTVSWITIALVVGVAVAGLLSRRKRNKLWTPLVMAGALIVFLQFPWSDPLWRHIPELQFLQFPWRWLLVLALVFAALTGLAIRSEQTTRRAIAQRGLVVLTLAAGLSFLCAFLFWQPCDDQDNIAAQIAAFHDRGFEGTDEYTLQGVDEGAQEGPVSMLGPSPAATGPVLYVQSRPDHPLDPPWLIRDHPDPNEFRSPRKIPAQVRTERWDPERLAATVTTSEPGYAVLDREDYPAWRITLNHRELHHTHNNEGLIAIPIAAGANRIDIRWRLTPDQWIGIALSLLALAITLVLTFVDRKHQRAAPDEK